MPPTPPESPRRNNRNRQSKRLGIVAGLLAMCLVSGAAGGGATYLFTRQTGAVEASVTPELSPAEDSFLQEAATPALASVTSDIAAIAAKASVSVVEITVENTVLSPYYGVTTTGGSGSGVILTEDGYIVTNDHVVEGGGAISVRTSDGAEYEATLIGTDSKTDVAVIHIEAEGLVPVEFADSDQVQVGELAVAIGNSLGTLGGTVTEGIISAKDREITIDNETMSLLQTSAAVNPGNSGGGLFNSEGELIGIVNAKSAGTEVEGLGFAIPSNLARQVADDIIENGYVTGRVQLGVSVVEISDEQSASMYRLNELGVYVASVTLDNGLLAGDRIITVDGVEVASNSQLKELLEERSVGDTLEFVVDRQGTETTVQVTLTEQVPDYVKERLLQSSSI